MVDEKKSPGMNFEGSALDGLVGGFRPIWQILAKMGIFHK